MNKRIDEMKDCVETICEEANRLQSILMEFEREFKTERIEFFNKRIEEMGISDKVKVALVLLKLKDKLREEEDDVQAKNNE